MLPHRQLLGASYESGFPLPSCEADGAVASGAGLGEWAEERGSALIPAPLFAGIWQCSG